MKGKRGRGRAIFTLVSNGVKTQRDEWVYDFSRDKLEPKAKFLVTSYEKTRNSPLSADRNVIKWDAELDRYALSGITKNYNKNQIRLCSYRPFHYKWLYFDRHFNGRIYQIPHIFPSGIDSNIIISMTDISYRGPIGVISTSHTIDGNFFGALGPSKNVSRYRYSPSGERLDNITDWALKAFHKAYGKDGRTNPSWPDSSRSPTSSLGEDRVRNLDARVGPEHDGEDDAAGDSKAKGKRILSKDDIFHYVYGVLHDPVYRETYAQNLKREFPRIPFYPDFWLWAAWGETLMGLHIGYETVEPWPLQRFDILDEKARAAGVAPKTILKAHRDNGIIILDSETQLSGVPAQAWSYRLGNRSGLDWVLDQHKEKMPKDPTIREKFNTYRFADYKEKVVDLLRRITRVSVETVAITEAMKALKR